VKRAAGVVLLFLMVLLPSAVAGAQEPSGEVPTDRGSSEPRDAGLLCEAGADEGTAESVGTMQRVGDLEVTVTDTAFQAKIQDFFDDGYLRAEFTIRNTGDEPYDFDGYHDFTLLDLEPGGTSPTPLDPEARVNSLTIGPGEGLNGHILFPIGFESGVYRIRFEQDGFFGSDLKAHWVVRVEEHSDPSAGPVAEFEPTTDGFENLQDYEINITINEDGSATFREVIEYDFDDWERHGIYRDLVLRQRCNDRYDRIYPLHDVSVDSSSAPDGYVLEDLSNGKRIKIGDADRTITGEHTYVVEYTLDGTLNGFPTHDELYWNVVGDGWGVQLANVHVVVETPGEVTRIACYAGEYGSRAACDRSVIGDGGEARFRQTYLAPYQGMSIVVAFPTGLVPTPQPVLDERWSLERAFELTPATVGGTAALSALAVVGFGVMAFAVGRDRRALGSVTDIAFAADSVGGTPVPLFEDESSPVEFIPPEDVRPAQFGLLVHERVRPVDISATIVDLAVRGYLRIEEVGEGRKRDYNFVRVRHDATGLLSYEAALLDALVPAAEGQKLLSDHKDTFASDLTSVIDMVYEDGQQRRWFRRRPDSARTRWRVLGFLLLLVSLALLGLAIWQTHIALLALPLVLFALLVFFGAGKMPSRTPVGTGLTRRSRGFEIFMRDSEAPRAKWAEQNNIFSEYLPYAIVLGAAAKWAKTFEPLGAQATAGTATWWVGSDPSRPLGVTDLATSTSSFTSSASSTLTSTPASSGSSGFSGGGGGGGFSGGGGGGGGGGSW
jgi:uncharacterized membrane protein YgcG